MKTRAGRSIPTTVKELCDPTTSAFIVYDMQLGVVAQIADGERVVTALAAVLDAARSARLRVFFTRHIWLSGDYAGIGAQRRAMIWQHKTDPEDTSIPFGVDSAQGQIVPALEPGPNEPVIDKITMSCFAGTYLDIAFRDAGLTSFLIAGVALEVGIEPSVRHALDLNYIPLVISDACGSGNEEARDRSFRTLAYTGEVLTAESSEVIANLKAFSSSSAAS